MRKLAIKSMHLYGDGLKEIENNAIGRCQNIIKKAERLNGKPLNVFDELGKKMSKWFDLLCDILYSLVEILVDLEKIL